MSLYPLKFKPRLVEKIWGGQKISSVLNKPLPAGKQIGESWELYDFPPGVVGGEDGWVSAFVANGKLAGRTLHQLVNEFGRELLGDVKLTPEGQFPILIKFLDAREDLSVQVHPPAEYCAKHAGAHLKSEAWYVVQSDPGARILKGLKKGATHESFKTAIQAGTVEGLIEAIPVKEGHCHYLPSGTVHALGAGILAAEVQTPSDTTFRVFDFNRIEEVTGKPRKLHVDEALECIDFTGKPEPVQRRSHVASFFTTVTRLVTSDYFKLEKVRMTEGIEEAVPYDQPVVWMMLDGQLELHTDGAEPVKATRGETLLLPAKMKNPRIKTLQDCVWLEVTLPKSD
ncbi:MAG TPA: type I phosphomannose isomerase catalytic subunit [Tepidisphaeraceae bacterium]|jgi:mannose-6-phosphate isomerase|nr:type I phosphomannose isomerase catalytic subunit [Tepidisphaeraceae bacterium]